jgi:hypothetical protein
MKNRIPVVALSCALVVSSALGLAGCGNGSASSSASSSASTSESTAASSTSTGVEGVRFTIPSTYFSGKSSSEITKALESYNATDIAENSDGSYTVTMSNEGYAAFVKDVKQQVENVLLAMPGSKSYSAISKASYNDDFTQITLTSLKAEVTSESEQACELAGYLACMYQVIAGQDMHAEVTLVGTNGTTIATFTYPTA